jgi:hypothetical protein
MEHMPRGSLQGVIHDAKVSWDWDTMLQLLIDGAQVHHYSTCCFATPHLYQILVSHK